MFLLVVVVFCTSRYTLLASVCVVMMSSVVASHSDNIIYGNKWFCE